MEQIWGLPPADILIQQQFPVPGPMRVLRWRTPHPEGRRTVVSDPSPMLDVSFFFLLALAVSALLLTALAWLFTRRLVAPNRTFADAAGASGRGDPDATSHSGAVSRMSVTGHRTTSKVLA
jgi:hypothetical protein